jgi:pyrimidine-nucleoside phosphorylase/thymidine phosphorylase
MNAREMIEHKKRGGALAPADIATLVGGFVAGDVPDYQVAALLMAIWFRGLDRAETRALLDAMIASGRSIDLSDIPGPKIDKHSTGGVGDKISLPLVGVAAACGLVVPMVSGRGLGHTGGTLDKLEAIPGYDTRFELERYRRTLRQLGATIVGQGADLVPADRDLYALRDVTATVDCIPLIVTSILSKKFASGAQGVVMDVKVGSGAFMRDAKAGRALAEALVDLGAAAGWRVSAVLTRMDEPLGVAVGNAVEVAESIAVLRGEGPADIVELVRVLAAEMLVLGGVHADVRAADAAAGAALASGAALERFSALVRAHGGRLDPSGLEIAPRAAVVAAPRAAYVAAVDGYEVGMAVVDLGGGRQRKEDRIDPAVGLLWRARVGDRLEAGAPVAEILARPGQDVRGVEARIGAALTWSETAVAIPERILGRVAARGGDTT